MFQKYDVIVVGAGHAGCEAAAAAAGAEGRCGVGLAARGGEDRELLFQLRGLAGGALQLGVRPHQQFELGAAFLAAVFVDGHGGSYLV